MGLNTPSLSLRTKLSLVLVCRSWRTVVSQILYNHIVIRSPARADAILAALRSHLPSSNAKDHAPGYGRWTRHIEVYTHARGTKNPRFLQTIFCILQACPNLRMLSGRWIHALPVEFLDAISRLYGQSLQGLSWDDHSSASFGQCTTATPEFLGSFRSLQVLDLQRYRGRTMPKHDSPPALLRVQDLIISPMSLGIAVATNLILPALRNVVFKAPSNFQAEPTDMLTDFLKVHGPSITSIDVHATEDDLETTISRHSDFTFHADVFLLDNRCPNLVTLTIPSIAPPLDSGLNHPLRRIGLRGVRGDCLYPDRKSPTTDHLESFTPERYPNLEVVRTVGFLVDAETDYLMKDIFIWWVEKFEKQGVDFLDGEGVLWAYTDER